MSTLTLLLTLLFTMPIRLSKLLAHGFVKLITLPLHVSNFFASTLLTTPSSIAVAVTYVPC